MKLSRKRLVALVYVGISLVLIGSAVQQTWAQVEWFSSMRDLSLDVGPVSFSIAPSLANGTASFTATIANPSGFGGLRLSSIGIIVFVNSTNQQFPLIRDSIEVAVAGITVDKYMPPNGNINENATALLLPDVVASLSTFLNNHPSDTRVFVLISLFLKSPYGNFQAGYCYEAPGKPIPICPSARTSSASGPSGG